MLTIQNYVRAGSLEEAYALCQKKNNVVLGGMLWLKMQRNRVDTAIDLSGLGLDQIEETDSEYRLGAMVTLRQLELHPGLDRLTQGAMAESVRHIVGCSSGTWPRWGGASSAASASPTCSPCCWPWRPGWSSTAGGSSPWRTSPPPPAAGHPHPCDHPQGGAAGGLSVPAEHRHRLPRPHLRPVPAGGADAVRRGARPGRAEPFEDGQGLLAGGITPEGAQAFAREAAGRFRFGSNLRGSAQYRQEICQVLVRRGLLAMEGE